jgi:hypothetical protein
MADEDLIEVRAKIEAETNRVLDAVAVATGQDKSAIVREVMRKWGSDEIHRATIVLRVVSRKGSGAET